MEVKLVQATPDPINFIATIASISHGNAKAKNPMGLVKFLYKNGHDSVFEHVCFTFYIGGISRVCSHQLVRHRMCSFTQRSQRYCDEKRADFVMPDELWDSKTYNNALDEASAVYDDLVRLGFPKEDARYILPNATCTDLYMSFNLRQLIHIANERLCKDAQWEIRELVEKMCGLVDPQLQFMLVPKCKRGGNDCHKCDEK